MECGGKGRRPRHRFGLYAGWLLSINHQLSTINLFEKGPKRCGTARSRAILGRGFCFSSAPLRFPPHSIALECGGKGRRPRHRFGLYAGWLLSINHQLSTINLFEKGPKRCGTTRSWAILGRGFCYSSAPLRFPPHSKLQHFLGLKTRAVFLSTIDRSKKNAAAGDVPCRRAGCAFQLAEVT